MRATTYNNFVHFTRKSLFFTLVGLGLLLTPVWWSLFRHRHDNSMPQLAGMWVGRAHIMGYVQGTSRRSLNEIGMVYVKLKTADRSDDYEGKGELRIDNECPRGIDMAVSLGEWYNPAKPQGDGGLKLSGRFSGNLETERPSNDVLRVRGSAFSQRIVFVAEPEANGYAFAVDLHRGSLAELRAQADWRSYDR